MTTTLEAVHLNDAEAPDWVQSRALADQDTGCWQWTGTRLKRHGVQGGDRAIVSHGSHAGRNVARVMWEELRGSLPKTIVVRHTCDNPMCVRPSHLIPGTHRDNSQDARRRGRLRPGGHPLTAR